MASPGGAPQQENTHPLGRSAENSLLPAVYPHGPWHLIVLFLDAFDRSLEWLKIFSPFAVCSTPFDAMGGSFGKNFWDSSSFIPSNPFYKDFIVFCNKILHLSDWEKPKAEAIGYILGKSLELPIIPRKFYFAWHQVLC